MSALKISFIRHLAVADEVIPPLHFAYLASNLSRKHSVKIYEQLRDRYSDEQLIETILQEKPDILGFSAFTKDIKHIHDLVSKIRPKLSGTKIVLGGVQMTMMPEETYKYMDNLIDFGFAGESEHAFSLFVEFLDSNRSGVGLEEVPNLIWKENGAIKRNKMNFTENLDDLEFPLWELIPPNSYPKAPHGAFMRQFPIAPTVTSRGCPYACTFCAAGSISGKRARYRSVDNVIEEIKYLKKRFGVREIHIEDDNFSFKRERVVDFSERLLKEDMGITWALPNGLRLNSLDIKTLKLMRRAGCYAVNVGVESGNDGILKKIKKGITKETIRSKILLVKEAGIDVGGFFIIGFPGETVKEIKETIDFSRLLPLDRIGVSYFQPYPGTEEYNKLAERGEYKFDLANSKHTLHTISYVPKNLTRKELKKWRFKAFTSFYLRPRIFIKLVKEIRSFEQMKYIIKRGLRWLNN